MCACWLRKNATGKNPHRGQHAKGTTGRGRSQGIDVRHEVDRSTGAGVCIDEELR